MSSSLSRVALALIATVAAILLASAGVASADGDGDGVHGHSHDTPAGDPGGEPLDALSSTCEDSALPPHDGFQIAPACVSTQFGEVSDQPKNPQLLIVDAPRKVKVGEEFEIKVSTRNLVRDRFLAAGQGGYYLERAHLDADGLTRGHFHSACRLLPNDEEAPPPDRQAVFAATEDGGGGAAPDTVTVTLPGLPEAGEAQCAVWAGDGSHRMPMMAFANQIPAFDAVRIDVREGKPDK